MTKSNLLFDANVIYRLIRELPDEASERLIEGSTIQLAYYELGNALWRECSLLKRITCEEAEELLSLIYPILERMEVDSLNSGSGKEVLYAACKLNLTFYDAAYLTEAKRQNKILVTDDKKLATAAENFGVKTLSSSMPTNKTV